MESFVKIDDADPVLTCIYLFFPERYHVSDKPTWDGYLVIDSSFADRQRLLDLFPGVVL